MSLQPLQTYPATVDNSVPGCVAAITKISQLRQKDQQQWLDLSNQFVSGRRVTRVPATSADVKASDNIGDFNVTATYAYFLVNSGSGPQWVRIATGTF